MNCKKVIIVAGTGRNSGKTLLIEKLIKTLSANNNIVGIKTSTHFHSQNIIDIPLIQTESLEIFEEQQTNTGKDSSRMLAAGAKKVFYIQSKDYALPEVMKFIEKNISPDSVLIIESGGLYKYCIPNEFVLMQTREKDILKNGHLLKYATLTGTIDDIDEMLQKIKTNLYL